MALSADKRRVVRGNETMGNGVAATGVTIYEGALLCWDGSGLLRPASDAASRTFAGVAVSAIASAPAGSPVTFTYGQEEFFASAELTSADLGADACIADDEALTDAATATFDIRAGRIVEAATVGGTAGVWIRVRDNAPDLADIVATTGLRTGPQLVSNIPIGPVALGSLGTSAVHVAGSVYVSELYLPEPMTATGLAVLNGATAGTDDLIVALFSSTGAVVATSDLAGTLSAGTNAFQAIAFTAPVALSPGRYFIGVQCEGTTATTRRIAASTYLNAASVTVGVFGTIAAITPPTTTTATAGPIGYLY
jgi:hypothetical protein